MPVLIIGAACDLGRELASSLVEQDAQVRVYVEHDDSDFRTMGCKVAVGELDDIGRIESAMEQVHTVVLLAGGPEPPRGRTLEWFVFETADVAVRAAVSAEVVRFLALSELGAEAGSSNVYLGARGRADDLVAKSGLQFGILRSAPILGPASPLVRALGKARRGLVATAPGDGTQRLNPIWVGDAALALLAADARGAAVTGVWEIGGPETLTYDGLVERATGKRRIAHRRSVPGLPRELADAYAGDCVADGGPFLDHFQFAPGTAVDDALALSFPAG